MSLLQSHLALLLGSKDVARARAAAVRIVQLAAALGATIGLLLLVGRLRFLHAFSPDPAVISQVRIKGMSWE